MNIDLASLESYLKKYIVEYRQQYEIYCSDPPSGGGFPKLNVSPYIYAEKLECFLLNGGVVIFSPSIVPEAWREQVAQNFSIPNNSLGVMKVSNVAINTDFRTALYGQAYAEDTGTTMPSRKLCSDGFLMGLQSEACESPQPQ